MKKIKTNNNVLRNLGVPVRLIKLSHLCFFVLKDELNGDLVPPGRQHIYHWSVPSLWTNQPADKFTSDCMAGMYQSAVHPIKDVHSGLVGPILICNKRRNQEKVKSTLLHEVPIYFCYIFS